ncbi:hypothetical protein WJX82_001508 [Trebouxia sp. C0006]
MKYVGVACSTSILPVSRRFSLKSDHIKASWLFCPEVTTPPLRSTSQSRIQRRKRRSVISTLSAVQGDVCTSPVQEERHTLPDGTQLEVLRLDGNKAPRHAKPPLVMLHGSGHAAWCYQETFMPYFADRGHDTYAISFRSQGKSDRQLGVKSAGTLASHAADLDHFVSTLDQPPVIIAHSLSGLIAQRYVLGDSTAKPHPQIAGLVLLASAPPAGNGSLVGRTMRKRPLFSIRLTWGFITRSYSRSQSLFKEMFMSHDIPEQDLQRWFKLLQDNMSPVQLDVVVDVEAARETAQHFGQSDAIELQGVAHDLMLDTRWPTATEAILQWLCSL